ncbi:uncharacterized protein TNCV_2556681 [Trichonephila clavipes]|nr:uncharacterized protein TNCV_2556681 [Trichonephila clavipes]
MTPVVSRSFEHHTGDSKIWLDSAQFRGITLWGGQRPPTNLTRGLVARRLFRVPSCRKGTIHLQTSMSSPGFEPSPYGTAVSVKLTTTPYGCTIMY